MDYVSNHTGVKLPGTSDGLILYFWRPVLWIRISPELDYFLWPMFYDPFFDFDGLKKALLTAYFGKRAVKNEEKGRQKWRKGPSDDGYFLRKFGIFNYVII